MHNSLIFELHEAPYPEFTFAFQPIVDVQAREIVSYEALVRGLGNESASQIIQQVPVEALFAFDREARGKAIYLAQRLGLGCNINLNFLPQSLGASTESIFSTLEAAKRVSLSARRLVLEVTEGGVIDDTSHFTKLINEYRGLGLKVAIDDFGAGYSGLNLLAEFQPDQIKLDMNLIRNIERHGPRQAIVRAILQICFDLGIEVVAEGVETEQEYAWLASQQIHLFQGYLFAKPAFESLPTVSYPQLH